MGTKRSYLAPASRDSGVTTARESIDDLNNVKEWKVDMKKLFDGFDPDEYADVGKGGRSGGKETT